MGTTLTVSKEVFKQYFGKKSGADPEICAFIRHQWGLFHPVVRVEWY